MKKFLFFSVSRTVALSHD